MQEEKTSPEPKCPECETKLVLLEGKLPEKCEKCGFVLAGYTDYKRWNAALEKEKEAEKQAEKKKKESEKKPSSGGVFSSLGKL